MNRYFGNYPTGTYSHDIDAHMSDPKQDYIDEQLEATVPMNLPDRDDYISYLSGVADLDADGELTLNGAYDYSDWMLETGRLEDE